MYVHKRATILTHGFLHVQLYIYTPRISLSLSLSLPRSSGEKQTRDRRAAEAKSYAQSLRSSLRLASSEAMAMSGTQQGSRRA